MEIPQHHRQAVVPHIMLDGADRAIAFYEAAFGAVEYLRLERADGGISHAEIGVAGSALMLSDPEPPTFAAPGPGPASVVLHVYMPDVDAVTDRAVAAGAELLAPAADMPYGLRQSMLRDPFHHVWVLLTPLT